MNTQLPKFVQSLSRLTLLSRSILIFTLSFLTLLVYSERVSAGYSSTADTDTWGTNGIVTTSVVDGDSTYIGGYFTYIGPDSGSGVVTDTTAGTRETAWPRVDGLVYSSISDGSGGWYIGGSFTKVGDYDRNNIAHIKSDMTVDSAWNPNASAQVRSLAMSGTDIYAGGNFTVIGGQIRGFIARLDSTTGVVDSWNPSSVGYIYTIAVDGDDVYVGGTISSIGGQTRSKIAKLSATTGTADAMWNPSANNTINTIVVDGGDIYAGGNFTTIGGQSRNRIAKLDNTTGAADGTWNANANSTVYTIFSNGSNIYVGGSFSFIGGQSRGRIAKLNNTTGSADVTWNPSAGSTVRSIFVSGSDVYSGGDFASIGGLDRNYVAKLNNTDGSADATWDVTTSAMVHTITIYSSDVFIGGSFNSVGGYPRNRLAKIDNATGVVDATWNPNANNFVRTMVVIGDYVYVGGDFSWIGAFPGQPGSALRNRVAKLHKTSGAVNGTWNPNSNNDVYSLSVSGSDTIYAGGMFTTIGGQSRNRVAKLNTTTGSADATWNPNADSTVNTITVDGSDIYVGGVFTTIGGESRNRITKLDNTTGSADATWNPNSDGTVNAIAVDGSDIYVGGAFTTIGGESRDKLAKLGNTTGVADATWDPSPDDDVSSILVSGTNIFTGGDFTSIGGENRNGLAILNSTTGLASTWDPDGTAYVNTIAESNNDVISGGGLLNRYLILKTVDNLVAGLDVGLAADPNVDVTSVSQTGTQTVRVEKSGVVIADAPVDFSTSRDWSSVVGDVDVNSNKSVIKFIGNTGHTGAHDLYIPKGDTVAVIICPDASSLLEVETTCTNGVAFEAPFPQEKTVGVDTVTVSMVDIEGTTYYKAAGVTGTGGIGIDGMEYYSDGTWTRNTGVDTIVFENILDLFEGDKIVLTWEDGIDLVATTVTDATVDATSSIVTTSQTTNTAEIIIPAGGMLAGSHTIVGTFLETYDYETYTAHGVAINTLRSDNEAVGYGVAIIYEDNTVDVSAGVPQYLNMTLSKTSIDLGVLSTGAVNRDSHSITVYSNDGNGYTISVKSDGGLTDGTNNITPIPEDGTVVEGLESYGVAVLADAEASELGDFADVGDTPLPSVAKEEIVGNTARASGHIHTITYSASISSSTIAGIYTQTVTYTIASNL